MGDIVSCWSCGKKFQRPGLASQFMTGNAGGTYCPDCVRQDQLLDAQAEQSAAVIAAQQSAAEAAHRQARAAELEAAARAEAAQVHARAALASAVGQLDDAGLRRFAEQEQRDADRKASEAVVDSVSACVNTIETNGKPTEKVNYTAYGGDTKNADGHPAAVGWHNLFAAERLLREAREAQQKIVYWAGASSREDFLRRIDEQLGRATDLRRKCAVDAVISIGKLRAAVFSTAFVAVGLAFAAGAYQALRDSPGAIAITSLSALTALVAFVIPLFLGRAQRPLNWEDMVREAGPAASAARPIWLGGAGGALVLSAVGVILAMKASAASEQQKNSVLGSWQRDGHKMEVSEKTISVDGAAHSLTVDQGLRQDGATFKFEKALLKKGLILDDTCTGTLTLQGSALAVEATGDSDCAAFVGTWVRPGASPAASPSIAQLATVKPQDPVAAALLATKKPKPDEAVPAKMTEALKTMKGQLTAKFLACKTCDAERLKRMQGDSIRIVLTPTNADGTEGTIKVIQKGSCQPFPFMNPATYNYVINDFFGSEASFHIWELEPKTDDQPEPRLWDEKVRMKWDGKRFVKLADPDGCEYAFEAPE